VQQVANLERASVPVTAVVASCNEAHLLPRCLRSIGFVREIIVVDLESSDETEEMAHRFGCAHLRRDRVPAVEIVQAEMLGVVATPWMMIVDPDEELAPELARELVARFSEFEANSLGVVSAPMFCYFGRRRLRGTVWGGVQERNLLFRRGRVMLGTDVHSGVECAPGFGALFLPFTGRNVVHHYWATSWRSLLAKHRRYLALEGQARYRAGQRHSARTLLKEPWKRFWECFVVRRGFRDGALGLALSVFWVWYSVGALLSLRRYERTLVRGEGPASPRPPDGGVSGRPVG